jgi:hypothetical protein
MVAKWCVWCGNSFCWTLAAISSSEFGLLAHYGNHAIVIPGLLNEIASAPAHRFHGQIDTAPGRHHNHRRRIALRFQAGQQIEPFRAGGGIAGVVEVGQNQVEGLAAHRAQERSRRIHGDRLAALPLEQEAERFQYIGLIVTDQHADRVDGSSLSHRFTKISDGSEAGFGGAGLGAYRFGETVAGYRSVEDTVGGASP